MWTEIHDEIWEEIQDWTVANLYSYKANRIRGTSLTPILEDVVQDLYEARYTEEERNEIEEPYYEEKWKKEREEEWNAYCACGIPPRGKTPEEYEAWYDEFVATA